MPDRIKIKPPEDSQEFEEMCCDLINNLNDDPKEGNYVIYGRSGQEQNGIDIHSDKFSIVVQCKNYSKKNDFVSKIKKDYQNAMKEFAEFEPQEFIVMTSLRRNKDINKEIAKISENVSIHIWFWEDIKKKLVLNPKILSYYLDIPHSTFVFSGKDSKQIIKIRSYLKKLQKGAKSLHAVHLINKDGLIEDDDIIDRIYKICCDMTKDASFLYNTLLDYDVPLVKTLNKYFSLVEIIEDFASPLSSNSIPEPGMADNDKKISIIYTFLKEYKDEENTKNSLMNITLSIICLTYTYT